MMKTFQRKIVFPVNLIVCVLMFFVAPAQQNKERNLLSGRYSEAFLEQTLEKGTGWVQFPAYSDRSGWERVPKHIRDKCIAKGEGYLNYEWKSVPATTFLEFVRSGGRGPNEKNQPRVIPPLSAMFYAELFEG